MFITHVLEALKGTPWWVYAIFVYLISRGIDALKTRTTPLYQLFILPLVLFAWSVFSLISNGGCQSLLLWSTGIILAYGVGWLLQSRKSIGIDKNNAMITLPGSSLVLILVLVIFSVKYFFGYVQATDAFPEYTCLLSNLNAFISSAITGIFMGRVAGICQKYIDAPN